MPDEKKTFDTVDAAAPAAPVEPAAPESFDLADDLLQLEKLNLMRAVMLRLKGGRHPVAGVDELLKRRMSFVTADFEGPYVVRLICTWLMIFVLATVLWVGLWLFVSSLELNYFVRLLSTGFATLIAAMAGVAVFHPSSLPDEKKVKEAIKIRLDELRTQLQNQPSSASAAGNSNENSLADSQNQAVTESGDPGLPGKPDENMPGVSEDEAANSLALEGSDELKP